MRDRSFVLGFMFAALAVSGCLCAEDAGTRVDGGEDGGVDGAVSDGGVSDGGVSDGGVTDGGAGDGGGADGGAGDGGGADGGGTDGGADGGASDGGGADAGTDGGTPNNPPTSSAGPDQDVLDATTVGLDGAGTDPDAGDTLTFAWTQINGPGVTIADPTAAVTTFDANVPVGSVLEFELTVCDQLGACTTDAVVFTVVATLILDVHVAQAPLGDDINGDGSMAAPWATVGQGLTVAQTLLASRTLVQVRVAAGSYTDSVTMIDGVSLYGGYDASAGWARDVVANTTLIQVAGATGLLYEAAGGYANPTEVDGVTLEPAPGPIIPTDLATVTVQAGGALLRDTTVLVGTPAQRAIGIDVDNGALTILERVGVNGGSTTAVDGEVIGVRVSGGATVDATGLTVDNPMTAKRTTTGIEVNGATLLLSGGTVTLASTSTPSFLVNDTAIGVHALNGSTVNIDTTTIDPGGGFTFMGGVIAEVGCLVTLTDVVVDGGDASGPVDANSANAAVSLTGGGTLTVIRGTLTAGSVNTGTTALHYAIGVNTEGGVNVTIIDSDIDAGPGDNGIGVRLQNPAAAQIIDSRLNQASNKASCTGSRLCVGLIVDGYGGAIRTLPQPTAPGFSCCTLAAYGVVVENSDIAGGVAPESIGVLVLGGGGLGANPGLCMNASRIDAGSCSGAISTDCVGVNVASQAVLNLQNNVIYGGMTTGVATGVRLTTGGLTPIVSNNYIHGGDAFPGAVNTSSTAGLFLVNGRASTGARVLNNIINSGSGSAQWSVYEENHNSDPGRFQNNSLYVDPLGGTLSTALYRNCNPITCDAVGYTTIAEVNTLLSGSGQSTFGTGGCINDALCTLDDDPVTGDPTQATSSNCIDAGLERNQSCNICQTPWVDHIGTDRLSRGFVGPGAGCTQSGPVMTGDDLPDIGPAEN